MVKLDKRKPQRTRAQHIHRYNPDVADHGSKQLGQELASQGLYIKEISGDGNCLFRSLSDQLGESNTHAQIRHDVVQYLRQHSDEFSVFVEEDYSRYVDRMSIDGVYGDNLEVVAFSRVFRKCVKIYQPGFSYLVTPEDGDAVAVGIEDMLHIVYHSYEHYSSVRNAGGPHEGPPQIRPVKTDVPALPPADSDAPPSDLEKICLASVPSTDLAQVRLAMKHCNGNVNSAIEALLDQHSHEEAQIALDGIAEIEDASELKDHDGTDIKKYNRNLVSQESLLPAGGLCDHPSGNDYPKDSKVANRKLSARERKEQSKKAQKEAARDRKRKTKTRPDQADNTESIIQQTRMISI